MTEDNLDIKIVLGGRTYKLKVLPREESIVRAAVKEINSQLIDYQQKFQSKDKQDFLTMMLLEQKVNAIRKENSENISENWSKKLDELDSLLTKYL